jgi:hypothetical protein
MKRYLYIGVLAFASCTGDATRTADTVTTKGDTSLTTTINTPAQNMEYCFVHTDGTSAQDTTAVHLVINADKVSGNMNWVPKEKDKRKGTLAGTLNGNVIKAVWSFMQEGMKDTMAVEFKLSAQQLAQKPYVMNTANGRQQLNKNAHYTILYHLDNCK